MKNNENSNSLFNKVDMTNLFWKEKALVKLIEYSKDLLKSGEIKDYYKNILKFLSDDLFGYKKIQIFRLDLKINKFELLNSNIQIEKKNKITLTKLKKIKNKQIFIENNTLFMISSYSNEYYFLLVEKKDILMDFFIEEISFFKLLKTLTDSFYKLIKTSTMLHNKIVEISSIKVSNEIMNDLREGKALLKDACLKLYSSLTMDGVILFTPIKDDKYKLELKKGIKIANWDKYMEFIAENENEAFSWQTYYLVDSRYNVFGIVGFKMSNLDDIVNKIQQDVLDAIIPQMISILSERKYYLEANTDVLTNLYNRRYINRELNDFMNVIKKNKRFRLTVLMIDIDHFKKINDVYGHDAGDKVLIKIAEILKESVRDLDVVGRYGGEEFLVLVQGDIETAIIIAERIRITIKELDLNYKNKILKNTVSIGMSEFTQSMDVEDVLLFADSMLYKAKNSGRDKIVG